ncbi:MAG TPA: hypothetical protein VL307_17670 [Chitinophagaceae bacterium]|nr:hypothetical protein [Chitinophagaceae bacterium]
MKKHTEVRKYIIMAALLLISSTWLLAADGPDIEKKKTYSKSYNLGGNDRVHINNQFGEVKITTWAKSEVKVDINITVKASTEERATSILDNINIEDGKSGDGVYFKTNLGKQEHKGDKKGNNNQSMEINYEVSMPAGNPLKLESQFGKSYVPDMTGPVEISHKFGDLVAGNLSNIKDLQVEFGSAVIESVNNCKFEIKFSKAEIKKMTGEIKGSFEYCDKVKLALNNSATGFTLNNQFSKIEINVADGFNGDFDIHTNFGEFHNGTPIAIKQAKEDDEHGPKFDKDYSGKSGNGACKVRINSSFGTVRFI